MVKSGIHGITLIEVLVSLFILALILFGFDVMQIASLRYQKSAYYTTIATQQLSALKSD